jgi:Ras-related protein Rap-1A
MVVIGTKLDLAAEREVSKETILGYAVRWGIPFYETSAKRDWNVRAGFEDLVRQMRDLYPMEPIRRKRSRLFGKDKCILM